MDQDEGLTAVDNIVTQFNTYEDFLDSQITTVDLYYLEDESLARQLVELGYRGTGEIVKREDFEARKAAIDIARQAERTQKKTLTSAGKELHDNFLKALAMREEDNRAGKLSTVIFIRDRNPHGQEVSGYIDYAHRLKSEDFEVYFNGKRRLLPRTTDMSRIIGYKPMFNNKRTTQLFPKDAEAFFIPAPISECLLPVGLAPTILRYLIPAGIIHPLSLRPNQAVYAVAGDPMASNRVKELSLQLLGDPREDKTKPMYGEVFVIGGWKLELLFTQHKCLFYNWDSHIAVCNSSPNYQVIADNPEGLLFKYKRDRKILNVDPKAHPGDNSTRIPIQTDLYAHAVLFDHVSRRKT